MRTRHRNAVILAARGVVVGTALIGMVNAARGQVPTTSTWVGGGADSNWTTLGNWNVLPPTAIDTALFDEAPANGLTTISLGALTQNIGNLTFDTANVPSYTIGADPNDVLGFLTSGAIISTSAVMNSQTIAAGVSIANGATVTIANSATSTTLTMSGPITGAGSVLIPGAATVTSSGVFTINLAGNNSYSGGTTLSSNSGVAIVLNSDTAFGTGTVNFNNTTGLTIQPAGGTRVIANPITLTSGYTVALNSASPADLTLAGPITSVTAGRTMTILNFGKTVSLGTSGAGSTITLPTSPSVNLAIVLGNLTGTGANLVVNDVIQDPTPVPSPAPTVSYSSNGTNTNGAALGGNVLINSASVYSGNSSVTGPASGSPTTPMPMIVGINVDTTTDTNGAIVSGPFGKGTITANSASTGAPATFVAMNADRTILNPITLGNGFGTGVSSATGVAPFNDTGGHNLTFGGPVSMGTANATMSFRNFGKTVTFGSTSTPSFITLASATAATTLTFSAYTAGTGTTTGAPATVVINDVIQDPTPAPTVFTGVDFGGGIANFEGNILINGANTYKGDTTLHPTNASNPVASSQPLIVGIGVPTTLDGSGNIVSGPFGKGNLKTVNGGNGNAPSILEPVGADRVIANNFTAATGSGAGLFFDNPTNFGDNTFHNLIFSGNFNTSGKAYTFNLDPSVAVYFGSGAALTSTWTGGGTFQSNSGKPAGNIVIDDKVISTTAVGIQNLAVMTLRNDANAQTGNWTVQTTGTLRVGASHAFGASNVIVNGLLQAVPGMSTAVVSPTNLPTINATGKFDLTNDGFIYNYTSSDLGSNIRTFLKTGYAGGAWNGAGGINSSIAAGDATKTTALGYGEAGDLGYSGNSNFMNTAIAGSADIVRYTYYGDGSLDGKVDLGNDFNLFLQGYLNPNLLTDLNRWELGDYNYDNNVDNTDFGMFIDGYKASNPGASMGDLADVVEGSPLLSTAQKASLLAVVPEPTSLGMLAVGAMGLMSRRRRREA